MSDRSWDTGFLEPVTTLTPDQIQDACEAAFANATDLLEEADMLRAAGRCSRAYFLAHISCEELGKLPILTAVAVHQQMGGTVDWKRVDRTLRDHGAKIAQVLFMDSIVGDQGLKKGSDDYEADLKRMRLYTDVKNATLYSSLVDGAFTRPAAAFPCGLFDTFRPLAGGRLRAFESMYLAPMRSAGGLSRLLERVDSPAFLSAMETLTGPVAREAFDAYRRTGDESQVRALLDNLVGSLLEPDTSLRHYDPADND